jgi:hypothetical protein
LSRRALVFELSGARDRAPGGDDDFSVLQDGKHLLFAAAVRVADGL